MKKMLGMFLVVVFCGALLGAVNLYAEESADSSVLTLKNELATDKQQVKAQHETMKANAQAAKSEEKALRGQIKDAKLAGDTEKAKELRAQLKTTHQGNVQQMKEDKSVLRTAKKEVREDKKELRQGRRAARGARQA